MTARTRVIRTLPLPFRSALPAIALLALLPAPARADTLVDNVEGLTLDANGAVQRFTGLLIGDDGRIEQVLRRGDKRPGKVDYRLDGEGLVMVPGMIDSHVELMKLGLSLVAPKGVPAPQPRPEDRDLALGEVQRLLFARGITAVADMGTTIEDWQTYRRAGDLGTLHLRIIAYADGVDAMRLIGGPGPTPWLYDDRLRLNGVRIVLDGTLAARTAALKAPYADAPAQSGTLKLGETQLRNLMSRGAMDGFQVAVSATGDKAAGAVLDALDELAQTYKGERRWRIEGLDLIDPADLPRLRPFGVAASLAPARLDPAAAEARLGAGRAGGVQAWKALADAGVTLAFGGGGNGGQPFATLAAATTRQDEAGQPFGGWQAQQRLTREAALAAWTTGAAWAGLAEGRFGRLAQGQRADFVLVDRDPLLATPAELRAVRVVQTWVGGRLVFEDKGTAASVPEPTGSGSETGR